MPAHARRGDGAVSGAGGPQAPIALDAMGSDRAPAPEVAASLACRARGQAVTLVGDREALTGALAEAGGGDDPTAPAIVHAPARVAMDDDVAMTLRRHPDASVRVAARLVAERRAAALVSAGSTGAIIGAALLEIGRVPGVRRPAVAALLPVPGTDGVVLIDAGGTPDASARAMVGFARAGAALAAVRGSSTPRVGLLNVGAEPGRGDAAARAAHRAFAGEPGFVGNVEPADVLAGAVEVVVAEAFTGNVFLKTLEAVAAAADLDLRGGSGALLLGVRRPVVVAHGAADADALGGAVAAAADAAREGVFDRVAERVAPQPTTRGAPR